MTDSKPREFTNLWVGAIGVILFLAIFAWSYTRDPAGNPSGTDQVADLAVETYQPPSEAGYVGSRACADCHAELFASYSEHPMYKSTRLVKHDVPNAPSTSTRIVGKQRSLTAEAGEETMVHHEQMHDKEGKLIYDQAVPMQFVVGSGRKARSYLHQRGSSLCSSPINFFSDGAWALNPGYIVDDPRRFDRQANSECLSCHTGRLSVSEHGSDLFNQQPFHEMAIGCERCHGPGAEHVQHHEDSLTGLDPIVNPQKLASRERDSVCFQCHYSAEHRVLRTGRSHQDFRPGMAIEKIWTLLKPGTETVKTDGRASSVSTVQVQQMQQSRCFQSSGELTCISCHDPHRLPGQEERIEFFRNRCLQCHEDSAACAAPEPDRLAKQNSCIQCHMPRREMQRTAHATQTDHRILRHPNAGTSTSDSDASVEFFDKQGERLPKLERRRAIALADAVRSRGRFSGALERELEKLLPHFQDDGLLLLTHARVARALGNQQTAIASLEKAVGITSSRMQALERLTEVSYQKQEYDKVLQYSEQYLKDNPYGALVHAFRADALLLSGRKQEALEAAITCLELNPTVTQVRDFLKNLYGELGQQDKELEQAQILLRMREARPPDN